MVGGVVGGGGGGGGVFDFFFLCYPRRERGGRREEFDGVRDALDWVAVAGVDAGEERGAGGEVGGVAGTDGGGGRRRRWSCHVLRVGLRICFFLVFFF